MLLGFLLNVLRFHDDYAMILRSVSVPESLLVLFQTQTLSLATDSMRVGVSHPTSSLKLGALDAATGEYVPINERTLLELLESHCESAASLGHQLSAKSTMSSRDFATLLDVLSVCADQAIQHRASAATSAADEDFYAQTLCSPLTLECVAMLITSAAFQDLALVLWSKILRLALMLTYHDASILNAVNCVLQSIRCETLSIASRERAAQAFAAPTQTVLCATLGAVEALVRPVDAQDVALLLHMEQHVSCVDLGRLEQRERSQVFAALIECDAVPTCLAVLSALTTSDASSSSDMSDDDDSSSDRSRELLLAVSSAMRLVHVLITHNKATGQDFARYKTCMCCEVAVHQD